MSADYRIFARQNGVRAAGGKTSDANREILSAFPRWLHRFAGWTSWESHTCRRPCNCGHVSAARPEAVAVLPTGRIFCRCGA